MSKKVVLVGKEEVIRLAEENKYDKIKGMIKNKRLNKEALQHAMSFAEEGVHSIIMNHYNFSDVYDSITEFVGSKGFDSMMDWGETCRVANWIEVFYKSSEEMLADYNDLSAMKKNSFYNFVFPRGTRSRRFPARFATDYNNCITAICKIMDENESKYYSRQDKMNRLIEYAQFMDINALLEARKAFGLDGEVSLSHIGNKRLSAKSGIMNHSVEFVDLMTIIDHMIEKKVDIKYDLIGECIVPNVKVDTDIVKHMSFMYRKYLQNKVMSKNISDLLCTYRLNNFYFVLGHEDDESVLNKVFIYMVKNYGLSHVVHKMCSMYNCGLKDMLITDLMVEQSKLQSENWYRLLLNKKIETVEELKELKDTYFPNRKMIDFFSSNPFVTKHIRLDTFSKEDIEKISDIIEWSFVKEYFHNDAIPYSFAKDHMHKISERNFTMGDSMDIYSAEELSNLIELIEDEDSDVKKLMFCELFGKDNATNEIIVKNIKAVGDFHRNYNPFDACVCTVNKSLNLNSILTLL